MTRQRRQGAEKAVYVRAMFDRIARRYDFMNTVMTGGRDRAWRRATVALTRPAGGRALDVATGTGGLAFELLVQGSILVAGLDFSLPMLRIARNRAAGLDPAVAPVFLAGDGLALPFPDETFDCVTTGFAMRNVTDIAGAFAEMRRVLRPGGRVACLELTHPRGRVFRRLFYLYFFRVVPWLGQVLAGQGEAYAYLPDSLLTHPDAEALAGIMREAGLREVGFQRLGWGTVAIHHGVR